MENESLTLIDNDPIFAERLSPVILNGANITTLEERRIFGDLENGLKPMEEPTVKAISANASKAMPYFANPSVKKEGSNNLSKILAVGKVQSGKTAFFVSCMAMAFDNGYRLSFLVGGTKDPLREQNFERVKRDFGNNDNVAVMNFNYADYQSVMEQLNDGKNVVLVVLKNAAKNKNLGALIKVSQFCKEYPTLIVDDEGDEFSPGAPKSKTGTNKTHTFLSELIFTPEICTYLSVTATPQANFLISTPDPVSPDYCVLVNPGKGYIGGVDFHDSRANKHVSCVYDQDDFASSIPNSFKRALHFFIITTCIKRSINDKRPFSMLVNPSSFTIIHSQIVSKILSQIRDIQSMMEPTDPAYEDEIENLRREFEEYSKMNPDSHVVFEDALEQLPIVVGQLATFEFNSTFEGRESQQTEKDDDHLYKIYVGGSMLGRGLTIKNLSTTYIYNDSKQTAIDTLYQRARWMGYKLDYFDICRVYMTQPLQEKFIDIVESETDMWNALSNFLDNRIDIKNFPRLFTLNNEKLMLTRRTITKTVTVERMNPGYTYDKSIWLSKSQRLENRVLADLFFMSHKKEGKEVQFGTSANQIDFVFEVSITDLYNSFIQKYHSPKGASIGPLVFKKLFDQAQDGTIPDEITIIYMRYKHGEFRKGVVNDTAIEELPQGRDSGTNYPGDRLLSPYDKTLHLQIHYVYSESEKDQTIKDAFPILALNNPISSKMIKYVTGENIYGTL